MILRLRSVLATVSLHHSEEGSRVLERKSSSGASEDHGLRLVTYNFVAPLVEAGAPVTTTPDQPAAAK